MGIVKNLKERRVVQIVAAYLAAGWIGLEVSDQLVDREILPEFVYEIALVWFIGGIFAAMLVGWHHGEKGKQKAPLSELFAMGLLALLLVGFSGVTVYEQVSERRAMAAAEASALDLRRIAVPYFHDLTPRGELRHIADGLTESLIDELATVARLDVLSRGAVAPFRGSGPPLDSVARVLRAGTVVDGAVESAGDKIRIVVRLVDGQSGVEFSRAGIERPASEILSAREAVIEETARQLRELLGDELKLRSSRRATESLAAWTLYQRAEKARKDAETAVFEGGASAGATAFDRADSLLVQAQLLDPTWPDPVILWAHIAYRRSRLGTDLNEVLRWIDTGLERVARALEIEPRDARALEVRGTLKYWNWLLGVIPEREESDSLFREARADLERAVDLDGTLATAYSSLSHLYLNAPDMPAAVLAGRKAYQEDAYLEDADRVVWRIVTGSYNLGQHREMARWCRIGRERFPDDFRFIACEMQAMTTPAVEPDVPQAWSLLASLDTLAPAHQAEWERVRGELTVGGILARAKLPDSAAAVLDRAHTRITPDLNRGHDLYLLEAQMRTLLGQEDRAIDLLKLYAAAAPGTSFDEDGWWRALRGHPRWREVSTGT
jgi:TolB-like protein